MMKVIVRRREDIKKESAPEIVVDLPCDLEEVAVSMADEVAKRGEIPKNWRNIDRYTDYSWDMALAVYKVSESDIPLSFVECGDDLEEVSDLYEKLSDMGEWEFHRLAALLEAEYPSKLDASMTANAIEEAEDRCFYDGETLVGVAGELVDEGAFGEIPDSIASYIDYKAIAYDLKLSGDYTETKYGVISGY